MPAPTEILTMNFSVPQIVQAYRNIIPEHDIVKSLIIQNPKSRGYVKKDPKSYNHTELHRIKDDPKALEIILNVLNTQYRKIILLLVDHHDGDKPLICNIIENMPGLLPLALRNMHPALLSNLIIPGNNGSFPNKLIVCQSIAKSNNPSVMKAFIDAFTIVGGQSNLQTRLAKIKDYPEQLSLYNHLTNLAIMAYPQSLMPGEKFEKPDEELSSTDEKWAVALQRATHKNKPSLTTLSRAFAIPHKPSIVPL